MYLAKTWAKLDKRPGRTPADSRRNNNQRDDLGSRASDSRMLNRTLIGLALGMLLLQSAPAQTTGDDAPVVDPKHEKDIKADQEEGAKYVKEVEKQFKESKDAAMQERVQKIGAQMAAIANKTKIVSLWGDKRFSKFDYTFKVLEGTDVNAFSLPGGHIYVYEGLMKFIESDDELAGVLGHEIAHASLRHVATLQREANKLQTIQIPLILAAILGGGHDSGTGIQAIVMGTQALSSGWSVKAEKAADYGGFQYMMKSPYNPSACLTVVERLAEEERNKPAIDWGIYRTHPPSQERVTAILKDFKETNLVVHRSAVTTRFSTQLKTTSTGIEAWFDGKLIYTFSGEGAKERAAEAAKRLNAFFDSMPEMTDVRAQNGQVLGDRRVLLDIAPADAAQANLTVPQLADKTVGALRSAVFNLTFQTRQP